MNHRTTQMLLLAVSVLLLANLVRPTTVAPAARADENVNETPSIVRAQAFELIDKQGKVVAMLHVGEDGGGNIRLRSREGMVRVKLGATADGSGLILFDGEAEPAVHLASTKAGTSVRLAEKGKANKILKP